MLFRSAGARLCSSIKDLAQFDCCTLYDNIACGGGDCRCKRSPRNSPKQVAIRKGYEGGNLLIFPPNPTWNSRILLILGMRFQGEKSPAFQVVFTAGSLSKCPSSADDLGGWDAAILSRLPWLCDATVTLSRDDDIFVVDVRMRSRVKKVWGKGQVAS